MSDAEHKYAGSMQQELDALDGQLANLNSQIAGLVARRDSLQAQRDDVAGLARGGTAPRTGGAVRPPRAYPVAAFRPR
jgi:hypothetical protein